MVSPGASCNQDNVCHMSFICQYYENICEVLDHVKIIQDMMQVHMSIILLTLY